MNITLPRATVQAWKAVVEEAQSYTSCKTWSPSMTEELAVVERQMVAALAQPDQLRDATEMMQPTSWQQGSLVTFNQDHYPSLGQWFVQFWDGDEVVARVYANDRETLDNRCSILRKALAQPQAKPAPNRTTEESSVVDHVVGVNKMMQPTVKDSLTNEAQPATQPDQSHLATIAGLESSVATLSRLFDDQRNLLVEVEDICGRDGHGGRLEDGESEIIDKVRAHLAMTTEAQPQAEASMTREREIALREGYQNGKSDDYFQAYPTHDNEVGRMLFERGFNRGWDARGEAQPATQPGEVVVTKNESGQIVAVTRQDSEGRVLSVIAESDSAGEPVAYADKIAFESAMKAGKGCDVWPKAGDYEARTGRELIALSTTPQSRKPLTDWQIEAATADIGLQSPNARWLIARAVIAEYERINGIGGKA